MAYQIRGFIVFIILVSVCSKQIKGMFMLKYKIAMREASYPKNEVVVSNFRRHKYKQIRYRLDSPLEF